jgi:hypothetical protein
MKQGESIPQEHCFPRTFSVVKEPTVLNYREAVSFICLKSVSEGKSGVSLIIIRKYYLT